MSQKRKNEFFEYFFSVVTIDLDNFDVAMDSALNLSTVEFRRKRQNPKDVGVLVSDSQAPAETDITKKFKNSFKREVWWHIGMPLEGPRFKRR